MNWVCWVAGQQSKAGVTRLNLPCNLFRSVGKRNSLQAAEDMLHFALSSVAGTRTELYAVQPLQAQKLEDKLLLRDFGRNAHSGTR